MHSLSNAHKPRQTDRRTDMPQNGHGWSDGPTDPCTDGKRAFQASDGGTDGRTTENTMAPAPKGAGIKMWHCIRIYVNRKTYMMTWSRATIWSVKRISKIFQLKRKNLHILTWPVVSIIVNNIEFNITLPWPAKKLPGPIIYCAIDWDVPTRMHSALLTYHGLLSPNISQETPIAHPLGQGVGVFREIIIWPKFYLWI